MSAYTATGKRKSSMTHARRTYTCVCGKECRGNGGWSSHKRACAAWQAAMAVARPQRDTKNPCAICGWAAHMAIHLPVVDGPRKGQPWGHAYRAQAQEGAHHER